MTRETIDFSIQEAGCLLYFADQNLGGNPFEDFFVAGAGLKDLTLKGAIMAASLYQDDGYNVRVCLGDLTDEEKANWTSKVSWKLNLESGRMAVSGVCDEDLPEYVEDWTDCENGGEYHLGCFVKIPKGIYHADVYSYPPNDLAGGWMRIENPRDFRLCFGTEADLKFEKPTDYFARTRPNETPPEWIEKGWEEAEFLDFIIHLTPLAEEPETPEFESDGCILWQYRKPSVCPVGIRI